METSALISIISLILLPILYGFLMLILIWSGQKLSQVTWSISAEWLSWIFILNTIILIVYYFNYGDHFFEIQPLLNYRHHVIELEFWFNKISVIFSILSSLVFAIVIRFSRNYLFREPGWERFYGTLFLMIGSIHLIFFAGNLDLICTGWEAVGLCSVFLIGFFRDGYRPIRNSLRALVFYRICDAFLLLSVVEYHFVLEGKNFGIVSGVAPSQEHWLLGILLVLSIVAKSALFPFCTWLYRAMEGPSPSSAVFYGALSVHLGPFLLLRTQNLWSGHHVAVLLLQTLAVISFLFSHFVGQVRADAKSSIAYATQVQIALILLEISFGYNTIAIIHIFTHACFRTLQLLRASSIIQEFQDQPSLRLSIKKPLSHYYQNKYLLQLRKKLFVLSLNRFYVDATLHFILDKILAVLHYLQSEKKIMITLLLTLNLLPMIFEQFLHYQFYLGCWAFLGLVCSLLSLAESSVSYRFLFILGSQMAYLLCGTLVGGTGRVSVAILLVTQVLSAFFCWTCYRHYKLLRLYGALGDQLYHTLIPFLMCGLIWIGVPGSIVFIGEDLLFHSLISQSLLATVLMVCAFAINGITFFQIYLDFVLQAAHVKRNFNPRTVNRGYEFVTHVVTTFFIIAAFVLGFFPHLILRS